MELFASIKGIRSRIYSYFNIQKEIVLPFWFINNFKELKKQSTLTQERFSLSEANFYPCIDEKTTLTEYDRHYVYHPAWAARILKKTNPSVHVDISSILHFSTIISAFIPVNFYDYRPANLQLSGLKEDSCDLTKLFFDNNSIESLSCMHTVEHVGLGRYGDEIDYDGDLKAMRELSRVLKINGNLLFVVPVGNIQSILFNAHRIYSCDYIVSTFTQFGLKLVEFSLIPESKEDGSLVVDPDFELLSRQKYACGCFWFSKIH